MYVSVSEYVGAGLCVGLCLYVWCGAYLCARG